MRQTEPVAVLYVYAFTRDAVTPQGEAVDGTSNFLTVETDGFAAVCTPVDAKEFSQESIDARSSDLDWLGAIGYRHQAVVSYLMKRTSIVPLRAFTLFSSEEPLRESMASNAERLTSLLAALAGKREWTLRIEFDAQRWSRALSRRAAPLRELEEQIAAASAGKAFLLGKKLEEERKRGSREAEQQVVAEIEQEIARAVPSRTVCETRQQRGGAFPQIDILADADQEDSLAALESSLNGRYSEEGVTVALTGPWPPYTFTRGGEER